MNRCALDVGAHWGEVGLEYARQHPDIPVYAFEPDVRDAARIAVALNNYHVLALAVDERDGINTLVVNRVPGCSSLHPMNMDGLDDWPGRNNFAEIGRLTVPTTRLDTFLGHIKADKVLWLKIDTQGHDLAVLRSLGARLRDVQEIIVEVPADDVLPQYVDGHTKTEMLAFLVPKGFEIAHVEAQTAGREENITFTRHQGQSYG